HLARNSLACDRPGSVDCADHGYDYPLDDHSAYLADCSMDEGIARGPDHAPPTNSEGRFPRAVFAGSHEPHAQSGGGAGYCGRRGATAGDGRINVDRGAVAGEYPKQDSTGSTICDLQSRT